ncbi:hypothetical protein HanPI659440_Chr09g0333431 [Helianthus annuus]|nr:hypothetical protein HanPI659440_Chr09g0333431 [Helianthus annuus]
MMSLSNWMMGAVLLHASSKSTCPQKHVAVYASPLGFRWKPYATEREKERWRTRSRKASSPSSSQTFHRHLDASSLLAVFAHLIHTLTPGFGGDP